MVALVERGGRARAEAVDNVTSATLRAVLRRNASTESVLMTDEWQAYRRPGREFGRHETVNHSHEEYVRGEAHTNTVEGYFSIFKRGMKGVYQHCSTTHLQRYLDEFSFRYSYRVKLGIDDSTRTVRSQSREPRGSASPIGGLVAKRLRKGPPAPLERPSDYRKPTQLELPFGEIE